MWTTEFVEALRRSFDVARTGAESQSQVLEQDSTRGHVASNRKTVSRKGKEKADPPPETELSDTDASVDVEVLSEGDLGHVEESYEMSSPAIPHPALPEDSIWGDEEDSPPVLSSSRPIAPNIKALAKPRTSSLWLNPSDNGKIFESRSRYHSVSPSRSSSTSPSDSSCSLRGGCLTLGLLSEGPDAGASTLAIVCLLVFAVGFSAVTRLPCLSLGRLRSMPCELEVIALAKTSICARALEDATDTEL